MSPQPAPGCPRSPAFPASPAVPGAIHQLARLESLPLTASGKVRERRESSWEPPVCSGGFFPSSLLIDTELLCELLLPRAVPASFPHLPFSRGSSLAFGVQRLCCGASVGTGLSCCSEVEFPLWLGCPHLGDSSPWPGLSLPFPPVGQGPSFRSCGKQLEQDLCPWSQHPATQMIFNPSVSGKGRTTPRKLCRRAWRTIVSWGTCGGRAASPWS